MVSSVKFIMAKEFREPAARIREFCQRLDDDPLNFAYFKDHEEDCTQSGQKQWNKLQNWGWKVNDIHQPDRLAELTDVVKFDWKC
jgi:hypothetical protein